MDEDWKLSWESYRPEDYGQDAVREWNRQTAYGIDGPQQSLLRRIVWPRYERVIYDNPTDQFFGDFTNVGFVGNLLRLSFWGTVLFFSLTWVGGAEGPFSHRVCETIRSAGTAGKNPADVAPIERQYPTAPSSFESCWDVGPFG